MGDKQGKKKEEEVDLGEKEMTPNWGGVEKYDASEKEKKKDKAPGYGHSNEVK